MNFLAAMLLVVMGSEEEAFWMLVVMIERLLPADYFSDGLTGVRVDSGILLDMMKERLPALHAHFDAIGVLPMLPIVTTQWFISLFVFWLPTETLLRVWDCFFFDGLKSKNKTFFRAALTLFKLHESTLLTITDVQLLMETMKSMCRGWHDADVLVQQLYSKAWLGHFSLHSMEKKEQVHRLGVLEEVARRAEKHAARQAAAADRVSGQMPGGGKIDGGRLDGGKLGDVKPVAVDEDADEDAEVAAEMVAARMSRLSMAMLQDDDASDDGDGAEDVAGAAGAAGVAGAAEAGASQRVGLAGAKWEPRAYLLKRSPAKSLGLLKKFAWQRRWFEVNTETLCWYASSQAAAMGQVPLGRVPRSMVLTARPLVDSTGFEVDLGNRVIQLALDGVPKVRTCARPQRASHSFPDTETRRCARRLAPDRQARHEECTRSWIAALTDQEILGDLQGESCSHKPKFWKVEQGKSTSK